jgi:glutathione S-transferase
MKLHYSATSPFVRKVLVSAIELGLDARIDRVATTVLPWQPNHALARDNPLIKIPVLITDGGEALYDSRVICEFLDTLHDGPKLVAPSGGARWNTLRLNALADGILEAGILCRYESLRPEAKRWDDWVAGQLTKVRAALDDLDAHGDDLKEPVSLGTIAVACAIGWLEFRDIAGDIRAGRQGLFRWYDGFAKRPSMIATVPRG